MILFAVALAMFASVPLYADDFSAFMKPLFESKCIKCHGKNGKVKGKVNLLQIRTTKQLLAQPKIIKEMLEAIDANDMPPEKEPPLAKSTRQKLLLSLRAALLEATTGKKAKPTQYRRLNRFQYNNALKDLFQLKRDVFHLPEKLMTRDSNNNYFDPKAGKT